MAQRKKNGKETPGTQAFAALQRIVNKVSDEVYSALTPQKLTVSQFRILEALHKQGPLFQVELARQILKTTGNLTMVIDNLERGGLVERVRGKEDRRYYQIILTPDGNKLIKKLYPAHVRRIDKVMGKLTGPELEKLASICEKLEGADKN